MKRDKIIFWTATIIIFLFEGVMPALTSQTALAKEGISHLGYPAYFGNVLVVFKVLGAIALLVPVWNSRLKEWAYAGFVLEFIFACVSNWVVDGLELGAMFPLVILGILLLSYSRYHKVFKTA